MTELLKDTLNERADALPPATPDLEAILGDGRRRVRRRRGLGGALVAAALLGAAFIVPAQLDAWGGKDDAMNVAGSEATRLSWAEGSVIHAGGEKIDVGREIYAYVETSRGYVFTDAAGTVYAWEQGEVLTLGKVDDGSGERDLLSDGATVAWVDVTDGVWTFAYTEASGVVRRLPVAVDEKVTAGGDGLSSQQWLARTRTRVMALDESTLYAGDERGIVAFDLVSGDVRVLADKPTGVVDDVEGGQILFTSDAQPDRLEGVRGSTFLTQDLGGTVDAPLAVDGGDIAPGARYVMSENGATSSDDFTLVSLADGTSFVPDQKEDYDFFTGYAWIDQDRYLAFGIDFTTGDRWEAEAMACSASQRVCEEPVALPRSEGALDDGPGFQLPIGEHLG